MTANGALNILEEIGKATMNINENDEEKVAFSLYIIDRHYVLNNKDF